MKKRIHPEWAQEMRNRIKAAKDISNPRPFEPQLLAWTPVIKWLVLRIAKSGQIAKVENLGAGVVRVGIKGTCCPFCGKELK